MALARNRDILLRQAVEDTHWTIPRIVILEAFCVRVDGSGSSAPGGETLAKIVGGSGECYSWSSHVKRRVRVHRAIW